MKSRIFEMEALRKAFRDVYFAKEREGTGDQWQAQVMRRIRKIGPLKTASSYWPAFENMVWRLAPVNGLLILALTFFFLNMDFDLGYDEVGGVMTELENPSLAELFGLEG